MTNTISFASKAALALCATWVVACAAPIESETHDDELALGAQGESVEALHDYLLSRGYFPNEDIAEHYPDWVPAVAEGPLFAHVFDERTEQAVMILQAAHGLESSGVVDEETAEIIETPGCGNPIHEHGAPDDKWHHDAMWSDNWDLGGTYTYRVIGQPIGWSFAQATQVVRTAFNVWQQHLGVSFVRTGGSSSDIVIRFQAIDGPGNALAQVHNNYWGGHRHSMEVDTAEGWVFNGTPNIAVTLAHEVGHILGFDHSSIGGAIMFPTTNPFVMGPAVLSDDDLAATTIRYRQWVAQSETAMDIGVGTAGAWSISRTWGSGGYNVRRFNGVVWTNISGQGGYRIAVGSKPWMVDVYGKIYERFGVTPWNRAGTSWFERSNGIRAIDIGVASGQRPWIIGNIARGSGGYSIHRFNGTSWQEIGGAAVRVAVGDDGSVFVVNAGGRVYERNGTTASNPSGTSWRYRGDLAPNIWGNETGFATDVSVSQSGIAWVAGTASGVRSTFIRQQQPNINGADGFSRWVKLDGNARHIAVVAANDPWIVEANGRISRRVPRP